MFVLALLFGCESMPSSGAPFSPVVVEAPAPAAAEGASPPVDPRFESPEPFRISSEELAGTAVPEASAPSDAMIAASLSGAATPEAAAVLATGPAPVGLPALSQFPVRLLSTLPTAQPPRAILGLPNGTEVVVSPGSVLAAEGLVVMSVSAGRVQLAKIQPAGDHAKIESIELIAQYP